MKKLLPIFQTILILLFVGFAHANKDAIANYSGDGTINYLSAPGLFGNSGIEIKFQDIDLSTNFQTTYSLKNLPVGDPYIIYFVVPNSTQLEEVMKNELQIKILNNGNLVRNISMTIGKMINNQQKGLNRFYCLKGYQGQQIASEIEVEQEGNYSVELFYKNKNVVNSIYGHLLLERGGYK